MEADTSGGATALLDRPDVDPLIQRRSTPVDDTIHLRATERRFGDVLNEELQHPQISVSSTPAEQFWDQLEAVNRTLPPLELESRVVTVVGNRLSALTVARRLESDANGNRPALAAISPTPDELQLPQWQLIDTTTELDDRLRFWDRSDRSAVVIVDADLGEDATAMVERVRAGGSTVLRLTIDEALPCSQIQSLIARLGGNVVIDITFQASPDYALSLIDAQVPVATVDGHTADAGLVLALRQAVSRG